MSTYGAVLSYLKGNVPNVIESEFFPDVPSGQTVAGILNQDVQCLSFTEATLDLITSNQVFEHVPNDIQGYGECFRALKKGGLLLFTVPLYDYVKTRQLARLTVDGVEIFGEPEYHDSRTAGPESALTFWRHSLNDICARVAKVGFSVRLIDVMVAPSQKIPTKVICAVKR
jgi:SAM-dependent methyltransferase